MVFLTKFPNFSSFNIPWHFEVFQDFQTGRNPGYLFRENIVSKIIVYENKTSKNPKLSETNTDDCVTQTPQK